MSSSQTYTEINSLNWFNILDNYQRLLRIIIFYLILILSFLIPKDSLGQTTLLVDSGMTYTDSDGPTGPDVYSVNVSNCTSISYSFFYSFSLPWEGGGNMEFCDELQSSGQPVCFTNINPCGCDPATPEAGSCSGCWDFLWARFQLDGSEVGGDLIGDSGTTDLEQSGTISSGPICTEGATTADISIVTQTWAGDETVSFTNLMIVCWEGAPTIAPGTTVCEGEDLSLNGSVTDNTVVTDWLWDTAGSGSITNSTSPSATLVDGSSGDIYSLTTTDVNGCTGTDFALANFLNTSSANDPNITECDGNGTNFDLTTYNSDVHPTATIIWYDGDPDAGGSMIPNPSNVNLNTITDLWAGGTENGCDLFPVDVTIVVQPSPTPNFFSISDICRNSLFFNLTVFNPSINIDPNAIIQWYDGNPAAGGIPFGFPSTANPNNLGNLWVRATLNGCSSDLMVPTTFIEPMITSASSLENSICAGSSINLMSTAVDNSGVTWDNNGGDGNFTSPNANNTSYTPGPIDIANGSVTFTVSTTNNGGCPDDTSTPITVNITPGSTAMITGDNQICSDNSAMLNAGSTNPADNISWTTVFPSDGFFSVNNANNTSYTPGPNDIANGSATVMVTITNGLCIGNPNMFPITIIPSPTAMIDIPDPVVCEGQLLFISVDATNANNGIEWGTNGDGFFDNILDPNTFYTPGENDGDNGTVRVAITVFGSNGCPAATDSRDITVVEAPEISADGNLTICSGSDIFLFSFPDGSAAGTSWVANPGDGSFSDIDGQNPIYTPGSDDIANGSITFTVTTSDPTGNCPGPYTANHTTIIETGATVMAGDDQVICAGNTVSLDAILNDPINNTITWSSSGNGTFNMDNISNPIYTPDITDITNGSVVLTATTQSGNPNCNTDGTDEVDITITTAPSIMVGNDQSICSGSTAPLEAMIGGNATDFTWSTNGDGGFSSPNDPNATYTPGPNDLINQSVTITATTDNPNPACSPAIETIEISITDGPTVTLGNDVTICEDEVVNLNATLVTPATSLTWSTSGDGSFSPINDPNAVYTPGANDLANIATPITITATTDDVNGTCIPGTASISVMLDEAPTLDLGNDLNSCGSDDVDLTADLGGSATTIFWSTNGDGTFSPINDPNTVYTPGVNDVTNGSVILTAVTDDGGASCSAASEDLTITFSTTGNASFTYPTIGCTNGGNPMPITSPTSSGSFSVNNSGDIDAVTGEFLISSAITGDTYTITYTSTGNCPGDFTQDITIIGPDDPGFTYPTISCITGTNPTPNSTSGVSGNFTVDGGASIDPITGELDLSTTIAGNTYLVSFLTTGDCPASSGSNISILTPPDAGTSTGPISVCNMGSAIIDLNTLLTDADAGGTWTDVSTNPTDGFNIDMFDPNNQAGGTYTFRYTILANAACPEDFTEVNITVEAQETAILDQVMLMPCNDNNGSNISTINLNDLVLSTSVPGTWEDTDLTGVDLSDLNSVDFDGVTPGFYTFTYTLPATTNCPQAPTYTTLIEVVSCDCPAVQNTITASTCEGTPFVWNGIPYNLAGTYTQTFPDEAASGCDSSDVIVLTVIPLPTIDIGGNFIICEGDEIELSAIIGGSTNSISWSTTGDGIFDDVNSLTPTYIPGAFDIMNGSVTIVCGGRDVGMFCNEVTDNVIVNMLPPQDASFTYPANACLVGSDPQPTIIPTPSGTYSVDNDATIDSDTGILDLSTTTAGQTYNITFTSDGTCPGTATETINIIAAPNAGIPNMPTAICNENGNIVDLNTLLNGADAGGTWTETTTTPSTGLSGNQFDGDGQNAGTYTFRYTVTGTNCPDDFTEVTVNVEEPLTATITASDNICNNNDSGNNSIFNFNNLITAGATNGTWTDTNLTGVDLADLANVSFDGIAADSYIFTYSTPTNGSCPGQTYTTTIIVEDCLCPSIIGDPVTYNGCLDDGFEITVNGEIYNQTNPTGMETFTSFNTGCDSIVDVNLVFATPPNAGIADIPSTACNDGGSIINLNSLLIGADAGGTWTETTTTPSTGLNGNQFDPNGQTIGTYTFRYTVTSGNSCPDDFTEVTISVAAGNTADLEMLTLVCNSTVNGNSTIVNFNSIITAGDATGSWVDSEGIGVNLSNLSSVDFIGIATGTYTFTYTTSNAGNCPGQDYVIEILVRDCACSGSEETVTYSGCTGDGFNTIVNGNIYDENTPTGIEVMLNQMSCDSTVIIDLSFSPAPTLEAGDDRFACVGDPINLSAILGGAATTVTWSSTGDGNFDNDQSLSPVYSPGTTDINNGFVSIIAMTDNGGTTCSPATDIFTINFVTALTGSINGESTVCAGEASGISFELSGGTLYNITYSDGNNTFTEVGIPDGFTVMVNPTVTTTYTLESLTAIDNTCLATIPTSSVVVTVGEISTTAAITSEFDGFGVSCNGSSDGEITVTPVLGTAPFSYSWSNGSTNSVAQNLGAGFYSITVTDAIGCTEEVSATITEPTPISLSSSTIEPECFGDNTGVILIDTITGGNGPYTYSVGDFPLQVVSSFPVLTPFLDAGNYDVTLQDVEGCETITTVNIAAPSEYVADLGRDTTILLGDSIELEVLFNFSPDSILWTSTFADACVSCTAQYVMPNATSAYTVYAADSTGCSTTTEVLITIDKPRRVYIPNVFSPNGDGTNDIFYVNSSTEVERITKFSIFDRWGELVFNADNSFANDPRSGWNGELKDKNLNSAVFVYLIEVLFVDGERKLYSGDVTLVR